MSHDAKIELLPSSCVFLEDGTLLSGVLYDWIISRSQHDANTYTEPSQLELSVVEVLFSHILDQFCFGKLEQDIDEIVAKGLHLASSLDLEFHSVCHGNRHFLIVCEHPQRLRGNGFFLFER